MHALDWPAMFPSASSVSASDGIRELWTVQPDQHAASPLIGGSYGFKRKPEL